MDIPDPLKKDIRSGRAVLFLGAGATVGAQRPDRTPPPTTNQLRDLLSERFLGNRNSTDDTLDWIAELSISASDLFTVQDYIAEQLGSLAPAEYHLLLPTFRWRGIVTTNYDRLIEETYGRSQNAIQTLVPFLSNTDRVDDRLREPRHVGLIKLHGCITRTNDEKLPLILTVDQYVTHQKNRDRLFKTFEEWAVENPVVFIGQAVQDSDLRAVLIRLSEELNSRPRYYLVKPNTDRVEQDFWAEKRITVLPGTMEDFLQSLDHSVSSQARALAPAIDTDHPLCRHFAVRESISLFLTTALEQDLEFVHEGLKYESGSPEKFYKGFDLGWYPILENLDVRRNLTDTLLFDVVIRPEEDRPTRAELYVIRAEAGSGKTIFLRRLAWEATTQADALCLMLRPGSTPQVDVFQEIYRCTKKRLFIFVDDAAENIQFLLSLLRDARKRDLPFTIITAERLNEWNISCEDLDHYTSDYFSLRYLAKDEIAQLVALLRTHNSIGPYLRGKSPEEQVKEFEERAGRQLLVALHEATLGRPFEETLVDEYDRIFPERAKRLYLIVCILHRLNVPVRAGLIARLEGISFSLFGQEFLGPLEHVVIAKKYKGTGDYSYTARHPEIAQIIFDRILTDPTDRFNEYIHILRHINIAFSSDLHSFRQLIRAKPLSALFPDREMVSAIFRTAQEAIGEDAYLYQQMANYERLHSDGNLETARSLLHQAKQIEPSNSTILHTLSGVLRAQALKSERLLRRKELRREARLILNNIQDDVISGKYAKVTLVRLGIDELVDIQKDKGSTDRDIDEAIRSVERMLSAFKQELPHDNYLLNVEADFRRALRDDERSFAVLQAAFKANPRDPYTASKLANLYEDRDDYEASKQCLEEALQTNQSDKQLNYRYAHVLSVLEPDKVELLTYHFRRAFSKWDDNYEAQFWYARYSFESSEVNHRDESKEIFRRLRQVPMRYEDRVRIRSEIQRGGQLQAFAGSIERLEPSHGFIRLDGTGESLFVHKNDVQTETWKGLHTGERVSFNIGFTYGGAQAENLTHH